VSKDFFWNQYFLDMVDIYNCFSSYKPYTVQILKKGRYFIEHVDYGESYYGLSRKTKNEYGESYGLSRNGVLHIFPPC